MSGETIASEIFMVTPEGGWLPERGQDCAAAIGDPEADYDAPMFAVRNLGYIRVEIIPDILVDVTFHPSCVSAAAVAETQRRLRACSPRIFRLRYLTETEWQHEVAPSAGRAAERLAELCMPAPAIHTLRHERFLVEAQDCSTLLRLQEHRLKPLLQKWRTSFGNFDPAVLDFAGRYGMLERTLVIGLDQPDADPVFRYIGGQFAWLGDEEFCFRAVGDKVVHQSDKEYGEWLAASYKMVAGSRAPRYEVVTAALAGRRAPTVYERLLLPWTTASGDVLVTVGSVVRTGGLDAGSNPPRPPARKSPRS